MIKKTFLYLIMTMLFSVCACTKDKPRYHEHFEYDEPLFQEENDSTEKKDSVKEENTVEEKKQEKENSYVPTPSSSSSNSKKSKVDFSDTFYFKDNDYSDVVYVCTDGSSNLFHMDYNCPCLNECEGSIESMSEWEASDEGFVPCNRCYR